MQMHPVHGVVVKKSVLVDDTKELPPGQDKNIVLALSKLNQ